MLSFQSVFQGIVFDGKFKEFFQISLWIWGKKKNKKQQTAFFPLNYLSYDLIILLVMWISEMTPSLIEFLEYFDKLEYLREPLLHKVNFLK